MSGYHDETCDVYSETQPRARKEHRCAACGEKILVGHRYWRVGIVFDGRASAIKRCLRCQALHKHLRTLGDRDQWPDEQLDCGEEYTEHWGVAPPPAIAALAFVTADEMQKLEEA